MKTKLICLLTVLFCCLFSAKSLYAQDYPTTLPYIFRHSIDSAEFEKQFIKFDITTDEIQNYRYAGKFPVIVYLYYEGCRPVHEMNRHFNELWDKQPERFLQFHRYSVDIKKEKAFQKISTSVPCFLLFHPGKKIGIQTGYISLEQTEELVSIVISGSGMSE